MRMSDLSGSSSRHAHQRIVQDHANRLLTLLEQVHHRKRMALEPNRAVQVVQVAEHAMGSLLDPQSLSRPTLLWNRSHGDE